MKPKTLTTLGELQVGDRFHYLKRVDPWQVTKKNNKNVMVNQFAAHQPTVPLHKYDEMRKAKMIVIFLRHTVDQNKH